VLIAANHWRKRYVEAVIRVTAIAAGPLDADPPP